MLHTASEEERKKLEAHYKEKIAQYDERLREVRRGGAVGGNVRVGEGGWGVTSGRADRAMGTVEKTATLNPNPTACTSHCLYIPTPSFTLPVGAAQGAGLHDDAEAEAAQRGAVWPPQC